MYYEMLEKSYQTIFLCLIIILRIFVLKIFQELEIFQKVCFGNILKGFSKITKKCCCYGFPVTKENQKGI